ncbi:MAG: hypothetical protein KDE59_15815 [Anaerolineales bacterium]|nr:hypothetical protein [Anaerolineales bacterium]MCB0028757.1 hypothetical protein [Anaerolineales bacterium]MCB8959126.1 hypothetical protein [Ardenticatenales bacterium]
MDKPRVTLLGLGLLLLFLTLACGLSAPSVPEGFDATAEVVRGTVEAAAVLAGQEAATAAAGLQQADLVATASAAGEQVGALATAVIVEGADVVATLEGAGYDTAYLEEKFASVIANDNGNISVTLLEEEVNAVLLMREQAAIEAGETRQIRNVRVDFQGNGSLLLLGDIQEPFVAQLVVAFRPVLTNGELTFDIESAEIGRADVPAFVLDAMETTINNNLTAAINNLPANVTVASVVIDDSSLLLTGTASQ